MTTVTSISEQPAPQPTYELTSAQQFSAEQPAYVKHFTLSFPYPLNEINKRELLDTIETFVESQQTLSQLGALYKLTIEHSQELEPKILMYLVK